jgi:hypothetical protein
MNKIHQEEILDWVRAAVKELDKLENDRSSRNLKNGGKALLEEIEKERVIKKKKSKQKSF